MSPEGGSTLITSAPKSDKITAAPGPAMKLARSTTFSPEKMLSLVTGVSPDMVEQRLASVELSRAFPKEGGRAFLLVLCCGTKAEVVGTHQLALALAALHALVCRLEGELDGHRSVGGDLLQDCLRALDQAAGGDDLVHQAYAIGLLCRDHLAGEDELKGPASADQARQPLRAAAARDQPQCDFRLAKLRRLNGDPYCAGHRRLAATAQREAVHGCNDRLSKIFDEVDDLLSEAAGLFSLERGSLRELTDVSARNEGLVAGACQND